MFKSQILRRAAYVAKPYSRKALPIYPTSIRHFTAIPALRNKKNDHSDASTASPPGKSGDHEGKFARTEDGFVVQYPKSGDLPTSQLEQGKGGFHAKRTLSTFSMEGRTAVVTGAARGLGLVMAQALVYSGADVAIVDLNQEEAQRSAETLMASYKEDNAEEDRYNCRL